MDIVFVLPGKGRSGGVRVTVEMANRLIVRKHKVRIVYRDPPLFSKNKIIQIKSSIINTIKGLDNDNWLTEFKGKIKKYSKLDHIKLRDDEIVIAVGTYTIEDVYKLKKNVIKLRYCHGFDIINMDLTKSAWRLPMPTIAVSKTLEPMYEQLTNDKILEIIPNGINTNDYFFDEFNKNGIGTIYGPHPIKAPEDIFKLMNRIKNNWSNLPQYIFGEVDKPNELLSTNYVKLPSVTKARELYSRSKIWILASKSEAFPGPILEAMACGCAVISTDTFGGRELIEHESNGFLVPVGGIDEFMHYIELLLTDESLREKIVKEGFKTVKKFSWENSVEKMNTFLKKFYISNTQTQYK